jgi:hypothetical protein
MSTGLDETSADVSLPDTTTNLKVPKHGLGTQAKLEHGRKPTQHRTPFLEATSSPEKPRPTTTAQATLYSKNLHAPLRSVSNSDQVASASHDEKREPKEVPDKFEDLQPWLFQEFGDVVELVSD